MTCIASILPFPFPTITSLCLNAFIMCFHSPMPSIVTLLAMDEYEYEGLMESESEFGKFDIASLSQQESMELLVADLPDASKRVFQDDTENFLDITQWNGLSLNANGEINAIQWRKAFEGGQIDLRFVPHTVGTLMVRECCLTGTADLSRLPSSLESLHLTRNVLSGSIDLTAMPVGLVTVNMSQNKIEGSIDLTRMPSGLAYLSLHDNLLVGTVDLRSLPAGLKELCLRNNALSGAIDLGHLPGALEDLDLCYNKLMGAVRLVHCPASLRDIDLSDNAFAGEAVVDDSHNFVIDLSGNAITKVCRPDGGTLEKVTVVRD